MDISQNILDMLSSHLKDGESLLFTYQQEAISAKQVFSPGGLFGLFIDKIAPRFNYVYGQKIATKTTMDRSSLLKKKVELTDKPHVCFLVLFVIYHELMNVRDANEINLDEYFT